MLRQGYQTHPGSHFLKIQINILLICCCIMPSLQSGEWNFSERFTVIFPHLIMHTMNTMYSRGWAKQLNRSVNLEELYSLFFFQPLV